jgi:hypothetical protein
MKSLVRSAALLALLGAAAPAIAEESCDVPAAERQPIEALQQKLEAAGWQIRSLLEEEGCYEAYAIDDKGERVEAYFDPKTLERVGAENEDDY